jgi:hypothetical protein
MSNSDYELDTMGARRILCAILEQSYVDIGAWKKEDRDHAKLFIESKAFNACCKALGLNEKRIRRVSLEIYKKTENEENDRNPNRKKQPAAKKYQLEEVSGELRADIQETEK